MRVLVRARIDGQTRREAAMETASKGAFVAVGDADGMLWMFRLRQCHATGLPAGRRSRQATWHHPSETIPKKARLALEGFE